MSEHYDFIIIGSGFGGSVSALRLSEKGYRVLVIEKGRRFQPRDFPRTNWDLRRWLWLPQLNFRGLFKMTLFRHVTVLSGVGVGGGSLVYANTLPIPQTPFFEADSWGHLASWEEELAPHYQTARRMLGAATNPRLEAGDEALREIARDLGREEHFHPTDVAVHFGEPGRRVPDPYFDGKGPERVGCTFCGACMTGCRVGAKNTLDKNYLHLAEGLGARILPDTEVESVRPRSEGGYEVAGSHRGSGWLARRRPVAFTADRVIFSGGVLGTVDLLLKLRDDRAALPGLSPRLGDRVRTNSESLMGVITSRKEIDISRGVAIGSILHTDEHSHIEPVRYGAGSGFFRLLVAPHAPGRTLIHRLLGTLGTLARQPARWMRALTVPDFSRSAQILLYMRSLEGTLRLRRGRGPFNGFTDGMVSSMSEGEPPSAFMPEATELGRRFAEKVDGVTLSLASETVMGTPTTAHILGGCCMGSSAEEGVIDHQHRVFGYPGLYVIDGSAVSANPGVNPSLTITALAERAMSFIPDAATAAAG